MAKPSYTEQSPIAVAMRSRCPRCGRGHLFSEFLNLALRRDVCGLDYGFADPADGPAFSVMTTAAVPATAFAIWLELTYSPPLWVHPVTTLPIVLIACTVPHRFFKDWLVAEQHIRKAEEGRIARPGVSTSDPT